MVITDRERDRQTERQRDRQRDRQRQRESEVTFTSNSTLAKEAFFSKKKKKMAPKIFTTPYSMPFLSVLH